MLNEVGYCMIVGQHPLLFRRAQYFYRAKRKDQKW